MSNIQERDDGQFQLTLPSGRVSVSSSRRLLEKTEARMSQSAEAEAAFLAAWKQGVLLADGFWFDIRSESVMAATSKDALRPDIKKIERELGQLSPSEALFLFAMVSFFNAPAAGRLFAAAVGYSGTPGALAATLDAKRRGVLADLTRNYQGW